MGVGYSFWFSSIENAFGYQRMRWFNQFINTNLQKG